MKTVDLINEIVEILGTEYNVINAFNAEGDIDLSGVLTVTVNEAENLHHGTAKDYRYNIGVSGQTLTVQDRTQQTIYGMFDYVKETIENADFPALIEPCAGAAIQGGNIESDGETNNFTFTFDLFICED